MFATELIAKLAHAINEVGGDDCVYIRIGDKVYDINSINTEEGFDIVASDEV